MNVKTSIVMLRLSEGQWEQAEQLARDTLRALRERLQSNGSEGEGYLLTILAYSLYFQERYDEAATEAQNAVNILKKVGSSYEPHLAAALQVLADSLVRLGDYKAAAVAAANSRDIFRYLGNMQWRVARAESTLGEVLFRMGAESEAIKKFKYARTVLQDEEEDMARFAFTENERRIAMLADVVPRN